jgi:hypothetical protein
MGMAYAIARTLARAVPGTVGPTYEDDAAVPVRVSTAIGASGIAPIAPRCLRALLARLRFAGRVPGNIVGGRC